MKRQPTLKYFVALLTTAFLFVLPQSIYSQQNSEVKHLSPAQKKIEKLLSAIQPDSPDSLKAKNYNRVSCYSDNLDDKMEYAKLSLEFCKPSDSSLISSNYHELGYALYMKDEAREA